MTTLKDLGTYLWEMYVTLKLDDSRCISDGNEKIVSNQRYVVMLWKMVTRYGTNMTLEESVEEIKKREKDRKLVCRFEAEHRDEISEILGLIDYIDKGYVEEIHTSSYVEEIHTRVHRYEWKTSKGRL